VTRYFLGADVGASKTRILIADEEGRAIGFGSTGPGNHETVGYAGLAAALVTATDQALAAARISKDVISGAGFGVAGFDWPSEKADTLHAIGTLGLSASIEAVNDTMLGLLAGSSEGWGIAVVSGTGCNCRGWTRDRQREGMVTGAGPSMGEGAGASELVWKTVQALAHEWTRRGPATQLSPVMVRHAGARDLGDLLEGLINDRYRLNAAAAPLVFDVAAAGDAVALDLIRWAGRELGELVNAVVRQLQFEALDFEVVMVGSLFNGSPLLADSMQETVRIVAPGARFVRLGVPPVVGAVLLGMEQAGCSPTLAIRETLARTATELCR
jgi:N-acetylglucosamine kinase-like BadF-type ATPase